nr:hypothetical protein CFP56_13396 [Quercus suber]
MGNELVSAVWERRFDFRHRGSDHPERPHRSRPEANLLSWFTRMYIELVQQADKPVKMTTRSVGTPRPEMVCPRTQHRQALRCSHGLRGFRFSSAPTYRNLIGRDLCGSTAVRGSVRRLEGACIPRVHLAAHGWDQRGMLAHVSVTKLAAQAGKRAYVAATSTPKRRR